MFQIECYHTFVYKWLSNLFRNFLVFLQNAPLTEQQQASVQALSHAVAERPYPPNLVSLYA